MEREMHPTMERLYSAAKKLKGVEDHASVVTLFNESPQLITNWEKRGISKGGMMKAQRIVGCSALWLETGEGVMVFGALPETAKERPKPAEAVTYSKSIQIVIDLMSKLDEADQGHVKGAVIRTIKEDITPYIEKEKPQKKVGRTDMQ